MNTKKYYQSTELQNLIDWDNLMKMGRYAGGHDEQMKGLFKDAQVIAHYNEGDWQGSVATCVKLSDGRFVIYTDYYDPCSGCDAWEDATDKEVRKLCIDLANKAYIFESLADVKEFLSDTSEANCTGNFDWFGGFSGECFTAKELLKVIEENENTLKIC